MELDDLKERWRTATTQSPAGLKEVLVKRVSAMQNSGRSIRRVFFIEMIIVGVFYLFFLGLVWFMSDRVMTFMYKMVAITAVATLPVAWRFYKSQKWINSMDYSKDMRSNMIEFLRYFKVSIRLYQWSTYIIIVVLLVVMFTDGDFVALRAKVKIAVVIYMAVFFFLTEPYLRIAYGRRITVFENFLQE